MQIDFNVKKIQELLTDFGRCTGLSVTLFDTSYNAIASGSAIDISFCPIIKRSAPYNGECQMCDQVKFITADKQKSTVLYMCHAGLTETVTPLLYDEITIGYIMLGKFIDKEGLYSDINRVRVAADTFQLDYKTLLKNYKKLPVISSKQLTWAINILHSCIQSLLYNQLIHLRNDILPQKIKEYILNNLQSPITVEHLCKEFFLSTKKLYTLFEQEFHLTVKGFILKERIRLAKKLLLNSDQSLTQISENTGFTDYSYFIRIFKKQTGLSPLKYRKNARELSVPPPNFR